MLSPDHPVPILPRYPDHGRSRHIVLGALRSLNAASPVYDGGLGSRILPTPTPSCYGPIQQVSQLHDRGTLVTSLDHNDCASNRYQHPAQELREGLATGSETRPYRQHRYCQPRIDADQSHCLSTLTHPHRRNRYDDYLNRFPRSCTTIELDGVWEFLSAGIATGSPNIALLNPSWPAHNHGVIDS